MSSLVKRLRAWQGTMPDALISDLAEAAKEIERLRDHISEQIRFAKHRIEDGKELGAAVWLLALEDIAKENGEALSLHKGGRDGS